MRLHRGDVIAINPSDLVHIAQQHIHVGQDIAKVTGRVSHAIESDVEVRGIGNSAQVYNVLAFVCSNAAVVNEINTPSYRAWRGPARGNHRRFLTGKFFTSQIDSRLR